MTTIELSKGASERILELKEAAKDRGLKRANWMEIVSSIIEQTKEDQWWKMISKHTPEDYLLTKALGDPKLRKKLLSVIKNEKKSFKKDPQSGENQGATL